MHHRASAALAVTQRGHSATDSEKLGKRVLIVVIVLVLFVAIISPSRRFGVGESDPVEPVGDGQELGPGEPQLAVIIYSEGYDHAAWVASTSLHAVEPRMKIQALRVPLTQVVDGVTVAAVDVIRRTLVQYEGRTVMFIVLPATVSRLVAFYRPFAEAFSSVALGKQQSHSLIHCDVASNVATATGSVAIVRSSQQSSRFWGRVKRYVVEGASHRWRNLTFRGGIVAAMQGMDTSTDGRLGRVECLPTSVFANAQHPTPASPLGGPPPSVCVTGPMQLDEPALPTAYHESSLKPYFSLVERECGTLPWSAGASIMDLRRQQHMSRSMFSTVQSTPVLKGNIIAIQLPHTTEMPLARWATALSMRAAEPAYHLYLVDPTSAGGRDPTPPASRIAELVQKWASVSSADSTFVWVSGPAVALSPFVDTLSLTLHSEAPVLLIGTCSNVLVIVAKNDPPGAAVAWLNGCKDDNAVDHTSVYVLGNPLNGTVDDDDGSVQRGGIAKNAARVELMREPTDDAKLCVFDDPKYVRALALRSTSQLRITGDTMTEDMEAFTVAVTLRCGSPRAERLLLGPWTDTTALESASIGQQSLYRKVIMATERDGIVKHADGAMG